MLLHSPLLFAFVATCLADCDKNLVPNLSFKISSTDLKFPCQSTKNIYTSTSRYIPKNVIATRMQIHHDDCILALPRYRVGVPFTLARFSLKSKGPKAQLEPYPCWSVQEEGNCDAIQNAIDLYLDPLDQLWVLDLGICNTLQQPVKRCQPKLWGISAETGDVVKTVGLEGFVSGESRLQYVIVDYTADGVPYAYVADAGTGAIIIVNLLNSTGYRMVLPSDLTSKKDILYMQLARNASGNVLYFSYQSSPRLYSIKASCLQSGDAAGAIVDAGAKPEVVLLGTDNGAAIFFRYKGESDVYIWNTETSFKRENFVLVQRGGDCRMPTQVAPGWKKLMWSIESNFHDFINNSTGCLGASMAVHPLVKTSD